MGRSAGSRPATPFLDEALFAPPSAEAWAPQHRPDVIAWTEAFDDEGARVPPDDEGAPVRSDDEGAPVRFERDDPPRAALGAMDKVADTTRAPWRWICSIATQREVTTPSGRIEQRGLSASGTGLLISPRHVLTAAHVLRSIERDGSGTIVERQEARVIEVSPGRSGDDRPFGKVGVKSWKPHPQWRVEDAGSTFDLALITLDDAVGERTFKSLGGQPLGWWGRDANEAALPQMAPALVEALIGTRGIAAGYANKDNARMTCGGAALATIVAAEGPAQQRARGLGKWLQSPRLLALPVAAEKGHSGGPVWVSDGNKRFLVGVLTAKVGDGDGARLVVVNAAVVEQLRALAGAKGKASGPSWFALEAPADDEGAAGEVEPLLESLPLEAPIGDALFDEAPVGEALVDKALVDDALFDEALADEALIDKALLDETPRDEALIDEALFDEAPTNPEAL